VRSAFVRRLTPTGFGLAALSLALPFVTVSCAPAGFGRAAAGGTASYTGLDLATGAHPTVDRLLPLAQQHDDRLGLQLPALILALVVIGGAGATWVLRQQSVRRVTATTLAAVALVLLLTTQATAQALLKARLGEQLSASIPPGKRPADYVHTAGGFALCLLLLVLLLVGNGVALIGRRRRSVPDRSPPAWGTDLATPADPWATPIEPG
jgi:hypothetical protein